MMLTTYLNLMAMQPCFQTPIMTLTPPAPWTPLKSFPNLMEMILFPLLVSPIMTHSCLLTPPSPLFPKPMTSIPRYRQSIRAMPEASSRSSMTSVRSSKTIGLILFRYRKRGRIPTRKITMRKLTYLRTNLDTPGSAMQEQNSEITEQ